VKVKFKPIVASLCLLGLATAGSALAATSTTTNAQIKSLQKQLNQLQMKVNTMNTAPVSFKGVSNVMSLNSNLSSQMMSNYTGTNTEMNLLQARQNGSVANQSLTVGGLVQADAYYAHTNTSGSFANANAGNVSYSDNPHDNPGNRSISHLALSNVKLATTVAMNNWATGYVQMGQSNIGETANPVLSSDSLAFTVQSAYLVLGNLAQNPVYGFVGKKAVDFGSFATVNPYSSPLTRTYFMANGNTAGIGYNQYGFNGTVSVMNGGGNYASLNANTNTYTANANGINNYALNAAYNQLTNGVNWTVGAGYLSGSRVPQATGSPLATNGAWDVNGKVSVNNFDVLAEFDTTTKAAAGGYVLGNNSPVAKVQAWDLGADYNFAVMGYKSVAALDYSTIQQGHSYVGVPAYQWVASYRVQPFSAANVWTGVEWDNTRGIVNGAANGSRVRNNTLLLDVTAMF